VTPEDPVLLQTIEAAVESVNDNTPEMPTAAVTGSVRRASAVTKLATERNQVCAGQLSQVNTAADL